MRTVTLNAIIKSVFQQVSKTDEKSNIYIQILAR